MRDIASHGAEQALSGDCGGVIKPYRNRVRVLAEVVNDADEITLASSMFGQRGWLVRRAENQQAFGYPEQNRIWLLIEVRLSGSARSAPVHAVRSIQQVVEDHHLGVWVRRAQVIEFASERAIPYFVEAKAPGWLAGRPVLARLFRHLGARRTIGLLMAAPGLDESTVRERLGRGDLGQPLDLAHSSIRPALDLSLTNDPLAAENAPQRHLGVLAASAAGVLACGLSAGWVPGSWKAVPLVAGAGLVVALVMLVSHGQPLSHSIPKAIVPAACLLLAFLVGTDTPDHNPRILVLAAAGLGLAFLVWRGVTFALRDSWFTRQAAWGIPLTLTVLPPLALYLGSAFDGEYLTRFGIPPAAVSVSTFYRLAIASRLLLFGLILFLIAVAVIGWARHFHQLTNGDRWIPLLLTSLTLAIYLLVALSTGLSSVNGAAGRAAMASRVGRQPAGYYGIQGILECVKPTISVVPVYDAPLPTGHPVLSFGAAGDRLWVWDPPSGRSVGVPLSDVIVSRATGTPARCH